MHQNSWQEKAVLITGGSGGVGKATAGRFLSKGANVMLTDINESGLKEIIEEFSSLEGRVDSCLSDVTKVSDCESAVEETVKAFGRLDVLNNTAGVWVEGDIVKSTEKEWDWVMDVNLKGTYFMCSRAIPELKKTRGCIVNLSSDAGLMGLNEAAIYCASKGGVVLLTKALAIELAPDLVRVNAICPTDIMTPMFEYQANTYGKGDPEAYYKKLLAYYPQGERARFIEANEVAEFIFFLASDRAKPITGAALPMDFGTTAGG
jgi:NAD(P)-dependent dehydrogenase (short-subunit alcohol dehydrogenase family)